MSKVYMQVMGIGLAIATPILTLSTAEAKLENSHKALVDQAWQIVQEEYVDRTFNQQDWQQVRQDYLSRSYTSKRQAYVAVSNMLRQLQDPYTRFLPPDGIKSLVDNVSGGFIGVGITVSLDPLTKEWQVVETVTGSPAAAAGIQPQDIVVSINGTPTSEIDPRQANEYIIGAVGSKVTVQIRRGQEFSRYKLVREQIDVNPLVYEVQETTAGNVGYIRMPAFTTKSAQAMKSALTDLEKQDVKGYVLDLRQNPGGVFEASIDIARMWMGKNRLISSVDEKGEKQEFVAYGPVLTNKPLVILVDEKSASASEVLAAALQDHKRAKLVGTPTFGKGVVQVLKSLEDGSGLVVTVAKYYTPKGKNINQLGVKPDIFVKGEDGKPFQPQSGQVLPPQSDPQYARGLKVLTKNLE
ncbi:S41 family peptidase [Acaryochloris sp. IP29b_bin.148]|uniref:S41 family peptidase n=1 Tax=Acaryochloris sp. IP29b_bin.148 TaxID=2969218 RepID=UPI00261EF16F|nr:S41 family peptidase [Acaryochloris sp. IP29b_bin.148]